MSRLTSESTCFQSVLDGLSVLGGQGGGASRDDGPHAGWCASAQVHPSPSPCRAPDLMPPCGRAAASILPRRQDSYPAGPLNPRPWRARSFFPSCPAGRRSTGWRNRSSGAWPSAALCRSASWWMNLCGELGFWHCPSKPVIQNLGGCSCSGLCATRGACTLDQPSPMPLTLLQGGLQ